MTVLEVILLILCVVLASSCAWMARAMYNIGVLVLRVQDTLEESLQVMDEKVESIDKILEIPLFSDSPEIKRLQKDMVASRDAILDVAYALSDSMKEEQEGSEMETQ